MMCFGLKDRKRVKTNHCVIVLLDDTQLVHELHPSTSGQDLLDVVIKHLNLLETSYFGLRHLEQPIYGSGSGSDQTGGRIKGNNIDYSNNSNAYQYDQASRNHQRSVWLDMNRSAIKQLKDVEPMIVYFGVKYYASDPCKLAEEITRYQFFLQCKQDILHSRLPVSFELAIELFALAVQSELGDYDPQRHLDGYVSEFQFLPNQTVDLEKRVANYHRQLAGQVPATAEMNFLERIKWLDLYGCEMHPIQYEEDEREQYALGLNPSGLLVLRNKLKVAHYLWKRIVKAKSQGRCFLMDVIDVNGISASSSSSKFAPAATHRFGFRLIDKEASQRLRWAFEEHKSFHTLIHNSANLNQMSKRGDMKLSQKFRHSIRSAINATGQFGSVRHPQQQHHLHQQQQQQLAQHQKLRSSTKSMHNGNAGIMQHKFPVGGNQQYSTIDSRPPSTVVRMPSRRYSNRSLVNPRLAANITSSTSSSGQYEMANGNGLPSVVPHSQTMLDSQRQRAIMMMSQYSQYNGQAGKSQTLRPLPAAKEAKKNQYYQQMMLAAGQQPPDFNIVPAGRHFVYQPTIYKANGMGKIASTSQFDLHQQEQQQHQMLVQGPLMHLFPVNQKGYASGYRGSGHESPRSSKSAIAPASAIKLASKKLAKQHQQMLSSYQQRVPDDMQALLGGYDIASQQAQYYAAMMSASANPSPRSVRSARLSAHHKSKSTNENLHLLHQLKLPPPPPLMQTVDPKSNKMLLATAAHLMPMPPPGYNPNDNSKAHRYFEQENLSHHEDMNSKLSRSRGNEDNKKRAVLALNQEQANLLLNDNEPVPIKKSQNRAASCNRKRGMEQTGSESDGDYCCSRSDCSSIEIESGHYHSGQMNGSQQRRQNSNSQRGARPVGIDQRDWTAIRQRHNEFLSSSNEYYGSNGQDIKSVNNKYIPVNDNNYDDLGGPTQADKNNNIKQSQLVKNIANKQATPILLSMNYVEDEDGLKRNDTNNKAVQLLNSQRQQLNSQSSSSSSDNSNKSSSTPPSDSVPSSAASSPKTAGLQPQSILKIGSKKAQTSSNASSSNTSGYYAGSNSTGSASLDSDNQQSQKSSFIERQPTMLKQIQWEQASDVKHDWKDQDNKGPRAKIY